MLLSFLACAYFSSESMDFGVFGSDSWGNSGVSDSLHEQLFGKAKNPHESLITTKTKKRSKNKRKISWDVTGQQQKDTTKIKSSKTEKGRQSISTGYLPETGMSKRKKKARKTEDASTNLDQSSLSSYINHGDKKLKLSPFNQASPRSAMNNFKDSLIITNRKKSKTKRNISRDTTGQQQNHTGENKSSKTEKGHRIKSIVPSLGDNLLHTGMSKKKTKARIIEEESSNLDQSSLFNYAKRSVKKLELSPLNQASFGDTKDIIPHVLTKEEYISYSKREETSNEQKDIKQLEISKQKKRWKQKLAARMNLETEKQNQVFEKFAIFKSNKTQDTINSKPMSPKKLLNVLKKYNLGDKRNVDVPVDTPKSKSLLLKERATKCLEAAKFRILNEKMYSVTGSEALKYFRSDHDAYKDYHKGYQSQVEKWPINPVDIIIADLQKKPKSLVIADLGCGAAKIAQIFHNRTVHSFDLVALNEHVTPCDISKVPLGNASVDVAVFCLSLMGINLTDYIIEAHRILKSGGLLKIAEVVSRIEDLTSFISNVEKYGFSLVSKDSKHKLFVFMDFTKLEKKLKKRKLPEIKMHPCLYKKR